MATEVVNVPDLALQFLDLDGKPLVSGHLVFFKNGTDIPESVYTSDGETALGNTIELDGAGFPTVQFSLIADKQYTVKAFDKDNVLLWTRNDVFGGGAGGESGDYIPMDGTTQADPVRGPLVWNDASGKNTIQSSNIRIDGTNNFNYISPSQVWIYTPTSQSQLYSNELSVFSSQTGREGNSHVSSDHISVAKPSNTAISYMTPIDLEIANSNNSSDVILTTERASGEAIESSRLDLTCGSNRLRLKCCENGSGDWIQSNETLRVESNGHLYGYGKYVHVGSTGSSGLMDTVISSDHGNVRITTDNKNLTLYNTSLDFGQGTGIYADKIIQADSVNPGSPDDNGLITEAAAVALLGGGSVTTSGGVQGDGSALDPVTLKLDATGNVTLSQGPDGLKANYSSDDEDAEYYSYPFTMTTHLLSRPAEMMIVPVHVDWSSNIRSVKFYNGTLGGATSPYMIVLYHSVGDINTPGSYLEPFGYYYKSDASSDIVKGWNTKPLTFRGENSTWDETEYLATNGEEIFVGFWSRDSVGVPYIEGYADKAMGCEYTAWGSLPTLETVKTDIQVSSIYALASHIHIVLSSEEAS